MLTFLFKHVENINHMSIDTPIKRQYNPENFNLVSITTFEITPKDRLTIFFLGLFAETCKD